MSISTSNWHSLSSRSVVSTAHDALGGHDQRSARRARPAGGRCCPPSSASTCLARSSSVIVMLPVRCLEQHLVVGGEIVELAQDGPRGRVDDGPLGLWPRERLDRVHRRPAADHQDLDAVALLGLADAQPEKARRACEAAAARRPSDARGRREHFPAWRRPPTCARSCNLPPARLRDAPARGTRPAGHCAVSDAPVMQPSLSRR